MSSQFDDAYPRGAVISLIGSDRMTDVTTSVLQERLVPSPQRAYRAVLNMRHLALLSAVAARLIPQDGRDATVDLAGAFHRRLAEGIGKGWRYAELPAGAELYQRGLAALDTSALIMFDDGFITLQPFQQNKLLGLVQSDQATNAAWEGVNQARWFEEILATLVDIFYAHPLGSEEIGFAGMADARGWPDVGIDAREEHEPLSLRQTAPSHPE